METIILVSKPPVPPEVKDVYNAMVTSAAEKNIPDAVHMDYYNERYTKSPYWVVGPNYEGMGDAAIYRDGRWYYRGRSTGEDELTSFESVLSGARIYFTG